MSPTTPFSTSFIVSDSADSAASPRPFWSLTGGCDLPWLAEVGALLLRVYFGFVICWSAGISKFPLDAWFAGQVEGLGFPMPTLFAWLAAMSEVAGGILLMIGLATRPAAFLLAFTLGTAAFVFHKIPVLSVYTTQHITLKYFWVYVFFMLAGSGRLSLDGLLRSKQAVAAGLALLVTAALAIYCNGRQPPAADTEAVATLETAELVAVAGSFNDWSVSATPMSRGEDGMWSTTISAEAPGAIEFKFVANEDWNLSAGEQDQSDARFPLDGSAEASTQAANIEAYLPKAGEYRVTLALPDLGYTVEPIAEESPQDNSDEGPAEP